MDGGANRRIFVPAGQGPARPRLPRRFGTETWRATDSSPRRRGAASRRLPGRAGAPQNAAVLRSFEAGSARRSASLAELLDAGRLGVTLPIWRKRIYATGISNGAASSSSRLGGEFLVGSPSMRGTLSSGCLLLAASSISTAEVGRPEHPVRGRTGGARRSGLAKSAGGPDGIERWRTLDGCPGDAKTTGTGVAPRARGRRACSDEARLVTIAASIRGPKAPYNATLRDLALLRRWTQADSRRAIASEVRGALIGVCGFTFRHFLRASGSGGGSNVEANWIIRPGRRGWQDIRGRVFGGRAYAHRDAASDVKGGPGPDIAAVTAYERAGQLRFRIEFEKAPPLAFGTRPGLPTAHRRHLGNRQDRPQEGELLPRNARRRSEASPVRSLAAEARRLAGPGARLRQEPDARSVLAGLATPNRSGSRSRPAAKMNEGAGGGEDQALQPRRLAVGSVDDHSGSAGR